MESEEASGSGSAASSFVDSSIRERTIAENSLVVLLQGLQGQVTTVELRNESSARGRLLSVDAFMNVRLEDVLYLDRGGRSVQLKDLFVTGRNVRYVHIPDQVDIMETIQSQLAKIHRVRNFGSDGGGRKEFKKKKCAKGCDVWSDWILPAKLPLKTGTWQITKKQQTKDKMATKDEIIKI